MFIRSKTLGHSKRLFHLSLGAFLVFLGAFVVCSNVDFSESVGATDVSSKFTVSLNDVLTISSPSEIVLNNCNPSTASLCTTSANVTVSTNNLTGYSLYLNSTSGSSSSLTNTATTPNPTIPTLSQSYSSANFPVNSWGYTGGTDQSGETGGYNCSTNYCPILDYEADPTDYSPNHIIKQTDAPAATSTTNLTFAAKADTSKASGTYTTSVTFTAVANEVPDYTARLDTGQTVNAKLKSLAAGTAKTYTDIDESIKSINVHLETPAPTGFIPSEANTISSSESKNPIYIIFDNTNDAGIMHFYTEGNQIFLPSDSSYMFRAFYALSDLSDLSDWDTSSVTNMSRMFSIAGRSATTFALDLSSWNTSKVEDMSYMFYYAGYSATTFTLNLSGWNTSNVTNMYSMFYSAGYSATTWSIGGLSDWNTSNVTNMGDMFRYAGSSATTWSVTIPPTNGNNISNTTSNMYGQTTSVYDTPPSGKSFTLAQP